jgi:hypothetical protein
MQLEGCAKISGQAGEVGQGVPSRRFQDHLYGSRCFGASMVAEHAEASGELVGDGEGFVSRCFGEEAGGGLGCGAVEEIETLPQERELPLPESGEEGFDFFVVVDHVSREAATDEMVKRGRMVSLSSPGCPRFVWRG